MANKVKEKDKVMKNSGVEEEVKNDTEQVEDQEVTEDEVTEEAVDELTLLKQENENLQNRVLRVQADFDNFRKRSRIEKEETAKYAVSGLVESLLPTFDNFERALQASNDSKDFDSLVQGVEMVYRQLYETLSKEGLEPIEAKGTPFNPELHQAVMQVEEEGFESGIVVEELQKGYKYKGKVIRPAMVKVNA